VPNTHVFKNVTKEFVINVKLKLIWAVFVKKEQKKNFVDNLKLLAIKYVRNFLIAIFIDAKKSVMMSILFN